MLKYHPHIINIILTSRIWKNLPLLFIFLSGLVVGNTNFNFFVVTIALVGIAFSSVFMTHLNIITDKNLDLIEKPHLYKMLSSNKSIMKGALILEIAITIACISLLVLLKYYFSALFILIFTMVTILYSYNFFSNYPEKNRFKVYWYGHFFVLICGYLSLWYTGFYSGYNAVNFYIWLPVFLSISLSEYGLFLFESAVDKKSEKQANLKTLAALLGKKNSTLMAIFFSIVGFIILILSYSLINSSKILIYCFLPSSILILFFLTVVSIKRLYLKVETFKVPDIIFNIGRLYILFSIIYIKFIA